MDGEALNEAAFYAWLAGDPRHQSAFGMMWRRIMGSDMDAALSAYRRRSASRRGLLSSGAVALLTVAGSYNAIPWVELHFAQPQAYAVAQGRYVMAHIGGRRECKGPLYAP